LLATWGIAMNFSEVVVDPYAVIVRGGLERGFECRETNYHIWRLISIAWFLTLYLLSSKNLKHCDVA
jgi:hypothetical protein